MHNLLEMYTCKGQTCDDDFKLFFPSGRYGDGHITGVAKTLPRINKHPDQIDEGPSNCSFVYSIRKSSTTKFSNNIQLHRRMSQERPLFVLPRSVLAYAAAIRTAGYRIFKMVYVFLVPRVWPPCRRRRHRR